MSGTTVSAAGWSFTFTVTSPAAVSSTFTPTPGMFTTVAGVEDVASPVLAGTQIGTVTVTPSTWNGAWTINSPFVIVGTSTPGLYNVLTSGAPLPMGNYDVTATPTP